MNDSEDYDYIDQVNMELHILTHNVYFRNSLNIHVQSVYRL